MPPPNQKNHNMTTGTHNIHPLHKRLTTLFFVMLLSFGVVFGPLLSVIPKAFAASPPNVISYQGRILTDAGVPIGDATADMNFEIHSDEALDQCEWSNDSTTCNAGAGSAADQTVDLTDGLFSENLGYVADGYAAIPDSLFADNDELWLEVTINGELLTPRKQITAQGFALNTDFLDGFDSSQVGGNEIVPVTDALGGLTITGDITITGDDLFMATNTSGFVLVADGTNYNPVDLSGDIDISSAGVTTIQANAVGLGADTTGNYVATVADAGSGDITVAGSGSESAAVTIDITDDALDFTELSDSLVLDAATTINPSLFDLIIDLDGAGTFSIADGGAAFVTFADDGSTTFTNPIAIDSGSITSIVTMTIDSSGTVQLGTDDDFLPQLGAGSAEIGAAGTRWDTIYGVAGDFSGAVSAGSLSLTGNLDMNNNFVLNIGDAGTDFVAGGGLNLAGDLAVNGDDITSDGAILLINAGGTVQIDDNLTITTGTTISAASVTSLNCADCIDFDDLEDTLDFSGESLTLNQGTGTWSQTFTGDTTTGFTYTANSLTSGRAMNLTSSSLVDGILLDLTSTSSATTDAILLDVDHTATYAGGVPVTLEGAIANLRRTLVASGAGTDLEILEPILHISNTITTAAGGTISNGGTALRIDQAADAGAVSLTHTGEGESISIVSSATISNGIVITANAMTSGHAVEINIDGSINSDTTGAGLYIDYDGATEGDDLVIIESDFAGADDPVFRIEADGEAFSDIGFTAGAFSTNYYDGSITSTGTMTIDSSGTVQLGTDDDFLPQLGAGSAEIGAAGTRWDTIYGVAGDFSGAVSAGSLSLTGNLDMNNNFVLNIGDAGTDFVAGGGLNLAGDLAVNGDDITSDGATLLINAGGTVQIDDNLTITTGTTISAASVTSLNCADCIDFDDFADTPILDAATAINVAGFNLSFVGTGAGDVIFNPDTDTNIQIIATGAPTADMLTLTNTGQASTTNNTDALSLTFDVSNASGSIVSLTPGFTGDGGDTYTILNAVGFTATSTAGTNTVFGLAFGPLTEAGGGVTNSTAINVGTGWDTILNSSLDISGNGDISDDSGAVTVADDLTVTGTTIAATSTTSFNCSDCIDFDDIEDTVDFDNLLTWNQTGFSMNQSYTGSGGTAQAFTVNSLTTGTARSISSTSAITSGILLDLNHTATYNANATDSGNLLNLTRSLTSNGGGTTLTTTGAVLNVSSQMATAGGGAVNDNASVVSISQNFGASNGTPLTITNAGNGSGVFIDQNGNNTAINIDSEATGTNGVTIDTSVMTTGQSLQITAGNFTDDSGRAFFIDTTENTGTADIFLIQTDFGGANTNVFRVEANGSVIITSSGGTSSSYTDGSIIYTGATYTINPNAGAGTIAGGSDDALMLLSSNAADNVFLDSPIMTFRGSFDSNAAVGPVTVTSRDATIVHNLTAGGAAPNSQLDFNIIGGSAEMSLSDIGTLTAIGGVVFGDGTNNDSFQFTSAAAGVDIMTMTYDSLTTNDGLNMSVDALTTGSGIFVQRADSGTNYTANTASDALVYIDQANNNAGTTGEALVVRQLGGGTATGVYIIQDNVDSPGANNVGQQALVIDVNQATSVESVIRVRSNVTGAPDQIFDLNNRGFLTLDGGITAGGSTGSSFNFITDSTVIDAMLLDYNTVTSGDGIDLSVDALTTGSGIKINRADSGTDFTAGATDALVYIDQANNNTATTGDALKISNMGGGTGTNNGDSVGVYIIQSGVDAQAGDTIGQQALVIDVNEAAADEGNDEDVFIIRADADGAPNTIFRVQLDGDVFGDGATYNTPADFAEMFYSTESLAPGQVVRVDSADPARVIASTSSYDSNVIGVVSTAPAFVGNYRNDPDYYPIALLGQVPTFVSAENGAITIGDPLTSASTTGYAMKATEPGVIIGYALENHTTGFGSITVLIKPGWFAGNIITTDGVATIINDAMGLASLGTATATTSADSNILTLAGSGWDAGSAMGVGMNLQTVVEDGSTDARLSITNNDGTEVAYVSSGGDLAISGRLYPSDRGTMQTERYIFFDSTAGVDGRMKTNASGWQVGSYDFAEMFPSTQQLEPGDVVSLALNGANVQRSTAPYEANLIGIVSTDPGFIAGEDTDGSFPVALAGRVPTKVTNENGAIAVGDPLTSSSRSGYAMRATNAGQIIGYALEASGSATDSILVFVRGGYWDGSRTTQMPGTSNTASRVTSSGQLSTLNMSGNIYLNGNDVLNVGRLAGISNNWSVEEDGTFITTTVYKTRITTTQGDVAEVSAVMSGEVVLQLSGTAELSNGQAVIRFEDVDPAFNDIISTVAPIRVLLTPNGATGMLYVNEKDNNGFTVTELGSNTSGVSFDWLVIAYRNGYEPAEALELEAPTSSEIPAEEEATVETPAEEVPVEETAAEELVVEEPIAEAIIDEQPVTEEVPVEATPAEEAPTEEAPVEETPGETPATEEPVI